jgi:hypothetical protein
VNITVVLQNFFLKKWEGKFEFARPIDNGSFVSSTKQDYNEQK